MRIGDRVALNALGTQVRVDDMRGWEGTVLEDEGERVAVKWNGTRKCPTCFNLGYRPVWKEHKDFIKPI